MIRKIKNSFRIYIIVWFFICITLYHLLSGFYDGLRGKESITSTQGMALFTVDNLFYFGLLVVIGMLFYSRIKKKVVKPIEELNRSMKAVSQGNLKEQLAINAQFEFRQMEESFNHMVSELSKAADEKQMQEQRNQQLYASIAHDLKTPMTMIIGYGKALQQKVALTEEKEAEYLQTIVDQTTHANYLLDELLAYTRLENRTYQMKMKKGDLAECLRSCVAAYYREFEVHDMDIMPEIPDGSVELEFDELEIRRVFSNLVSNILKHNPKKTVCRISLVKQEENIRLVFADSGPIIEKSLEDMLFEPFSVSDTSRNTKNGSGLGLSICKKIIERHNGKIYYESNWDIGFKAFVIEFCR